MDTKDDDLLDVARTMWAEARGEPLEGKIAVACVIINRFKKKTWNCGETLGETAKFCAKGSTYHQFSCWNENDPNRAKMLKLTYIELKEYLEILHNLLADYKDVTNGATHYYNPKVCKPKWAVGKNPCYAVGCHIFFNNID